MLERIVQLNEEVINNSKIIGILPVLNYCMSFMLLFP